MLLVGDASYYGRFGFTADKTGDLRLIGDGDQSRLLARELIPGTLDGARGYIRATGRRAPATTQEPPARASPRLARAAISATVHF